MGKHLVSQQKTRVKLSKQNKYGVENERSIRGDIDLIAEKERKMSIELEAVLDVINCGAERILSEYEKKAFQLFVREGKSYSETAYEMGCSIRSVRTHIERAAQKIRTLCATRIDL